MTWLVSTGGVDGWRAESAGSQRWEVVPKGNTYRLEYKEVEGVSLKVPQKAPPPGSIVDFAGVDRSPP